ncbi:DUF3570 domain-containing protein [bacterium]|nr:DUF3570 domain-containing protein [bacterium]
MQIIKSLFISFMVMIPFLKTHASDFKDSASIGLNTYSDTGDVQVYSPTFSLMKALSKNFLIGFKMRVDAIAAASIRNGGNPIVTDAVAGASSKENTFDEMRYAPTFLMSYQDGESTYSGGIYYSTENDYEGMAFFANYVRQFNEQNTAIGIGISQSSDEWKPVFDRNLPRNDRKEKKIDISVNQLLTPTASIQFVYSNMYSEGFLSSPYHYVLQDVFAKFENYPEKRTGHAFAVKGVNLLNDANSMSYSYRYYMDDWDITSHTLNIEWLQDFNDKITSGLRARYYTQTGSNFAKDIGTYEKTDLYFAADYRMSAFDSYDVGIPLIYRPSPTSDYKVTASIDFYQTSDNAYIQNWYGNSNIQAIYTTLKVDYEF